MRRIITLAISLMLSTALFAHVTDLPVKTINGKKYYYYTVKQGDTLYSLSKSFEVSIDDIIAFNPAVGDGLKAMSTIYFPQDSFKKPASKKSASTADYEDYKVSKGETIYGISKQHGITIEQLIEANPKIADGLKSGMTIRVPKQNSTASTQQTANKTQATEKPSKTDSQTKTDNAGGQTKTEQPTAAPTTPSAQNGYHTIKQGESLYGIAKAYGTSVDALLDANPTLSATSYRAGTLIRIPAGTVAAENVTPNATQPTIIDKPFADNITGYKPSSEENKPSLDENKEKQPADTVVTPPADIVAPVDASSDINIAVMLPFALESSSNSKHAQRATEFYKGFLIAVDSLRQVGTPIHITAFDIADNAGLNKALASPELAAMDAIVGPESDEMLAKIAAFADKNNILLFNLFNIRSGLQETHPSVVQANIPTAMMYSRVIENFCQKYEGYTPVFLSPKAGKREKSEFVTALKKVLATKRIKYIDVTYASNFKKDDFADFSSKGKYVFVPLSASGAEFDHFSTALRDIRRAAASSSDVALFGYPEWITFRGSRLEQLQNANATIFSRLYNDDKSIEAKEIAGAFHRWYSSKMENAIPVQGILGFDLGYYLISTMNRQKGALDLNKAPRGNGVQSCFDFTPLGEGKGWVNKAIFFIEFRPSGAMLRSTL